MSNKNQQRTYNDPPKKELLNPKVWEVWLATVPYEDDYSAKRRPVVVVDVKSTHIEVTGMTSRPPEYSDEFYLSDWKRVGLKQRSTVKTRRIVKLSHRMFIHKIGDLGIADITKIQDYLYQTVQPSYSGQRYRPVPQRRPAQKSGCYIATAVYGSYNCSSVWVLRRYRDYSLAKSWYGRRFIKLYYAVSPTIVKLFSQTKWFNQICKKTLDKIVSKLKEKGWEDSPYGQ